MKCPHCGQWNRDAFPRCIRCGQDLSSLQSQQTAADEKSAALEQFIQENRSRKEYIRIDEDGNSTPIHDERDDLAQDMILLQSRHEQGLDAQRRIRAASAEQNIFPTSRSIELDPDVNHSSYRNPYMPMNMEPEGEARPDAQRVYSSNGFSVSPDSANAKEYTRSARRASSSSSPYRVTRRLLSFRVLKTIAFILIILAGLLAAYQYLYLPFVEENKTVPIEKQSIITTSILEDNPAHTIRIPGEEGANIYIKELRRSYTVVGGYATIEVADYIWYENNESVTESEITATLTPYLKTSAGEQVPMGVITFPVTIPLSPLELVSPDTGFVEVSTAIYNIQFRVDKNSTVLINGEDFSDLVNTQNGLISYNATVQPIGYNYYEIKTRCQNYRENSITVTVYRAVQEIPLDLSTTLNNRSFNETMRISATTLPGASITVETPHTDLDLSNINLTGEFSFYAKFETIGTNTITIVATYPGKQPSIVNYDVYYLPPADTYTRKAWPLDTAWYYSDLLSNISARIASSQIYVCKGEIVSILSSSPQLAIMEIGDANSSRQVLLENRSTDTWQIGERYRVYADVYGLYNGMPRFVARYTYQ